MVILAVSPRVGWFAFELSRFYPILFNLQTIRLHRTLHHSIVLTFLRPQRLEGLQNGSADTGRYCCALQSSFDLREVDASHISSYKITALR
jgi:hypothetical protein